MAVLSGRGSGAHNIEGIGIGFTPPLWEADQVNEVMTVSTDEAKAMARRLAREEGIFGGTSSGANVVAAIWIAQRLGPKATVATIIVDSGLEIPQYGRFPPRIHLRGHRNLRLTSMKALQGREGGGGGCERWGAV